MGNEEMEGSKFLMEEGTVKVAPLAATGSGATCLELLLVLLSFSPHQTFLEQLLPSDTARQHTGKQRVNGELERRLHKQRSGVRHRQGWPEEGGPGLYNHR